MLIFKYYYFFIIKFYYSTLIFALILFILSKFVTPQVFNYYCVSFLVNNKILCNKSKKSVYECGFEPFSDTRGNFNIHFLTTAIMFLLFDVELIFLLPWILNFKNWDFYEFLIGLFFFLILLIGFMFELVKGALNWSTDYF